MVGASDCTILVLCWQRRYATALSIHITWWKISHSILLFLFFLTKKYLFSPFFLSLFIFLFQSFPLFFHLFIIFLLVAILLLSLMNTLSVPFLTISSLTKEYLHISSRTHAYSIATPSYITLSLSLLSPRSLSSYADHDENPVRE